MIAFIVINSFMIAYAFAILASSKSPGLLEAADGKFFPLMKPEALRKH